MTIAAHPSLREANPINDSDTPANRGWVESEAKGHPQTDTVNCGISVVGNGLALMEGMNQAPFFSPFASSSHCFLIQGHQVSKSTSSTNHNRPLATEEGGYVLMFVASRVGRGGVELGVWREGEKPTQIQSRIWAKERGPLKK